MTSQDPAGQRPRKTSGGQGTDPRVRHSGRAEESRPGAARYSISFFMSRGRFPDVDAPARIVPRWSSYDGPHINVDLGSALTHVLFSNPKIDGHLQDGQVTSAGDHNRIPSSHFWIPLDIAIPSPQVRVSTQPKEDSNVSRFLVVSLSQWLKTT